MGARTLETLVTQGLLPQSHAINFVLLLISGELFTGNGERLPKGARPHRSTPVSNLNREVLNLNREVLNPNREVSNLNREVSNPNREVSNPNQEAFERHYESLIDKYPVQMLRPWESEMHPTGGPSELVFINWC